MLYYDRIKVSECIDVNKTRMYLKNVLFVLFGIF